MRIHSLVFFLDLEANDLLPSAAGTVRRGRSADSNRRFAVIPENQILLQKESKGPEERREKVELNNAIMETGQNLNHMGFGV